MQRRTAPSWCWLTGWTSFDRRTVWQARVEVHKAQVEVHRAQVGVHKGQVELHRAQVGLHEAHVELDKAHVEPHSAEYTGMLSHIVLCTQDVEVHRTRGNYRNPHESSQVKVQRLSKQQYIRLVLLYLLTCWSVAVLIS